MTDASELFGSSNPMASDLEAGLQTVAQSATIKFNLYGRVILPADGYVFWINAKLLQHRGFQKRGLFTAAQISEEQMERCSFEQQGSLHFTSDFRQEEADNYAANRMVFSTTSPVQNLNDIAADTMYIGEFKGLRFGFSTQVMRYQQSGLWHYAGFALYPDMQTQVIDRAQDFHDDLIVSNSLPAWLALPRYAPPWSVWGNAVPPLYPSHLVPDNISPPFGSVHIEPGQTIAMGGAPVVDPFTGSDHQLYEDTVRFTLWGKNNLDARSFLLAVYDYCSNSGVVGMMGVPSVRDEKRTQSELRTIAQKKTIEVRVSYLQGAIRKQARQVIRTAVPNLYIDNVLIESSENQEE